MSEAVEWFTDSEALASWLDEHSWFEDAMVRMISPAPSETRSAPPELVTMELAYQVGGGLRAGDTRRLRRMQIRCSGVTRFELEDRAAHSPQHWSEGVELLPSTEGISFAIDVPGRLTIACARVDAVELPEATETVQSWESDRQISITLADGLPSPAEIVEQCRARTGVKIVWRIYSTEAVPVSSVPVAGYDGWFLQLPERISEELGGIMLGVHVAPTALALTLTRMASREGNDLLWAAVLKTFSSFKVSQATCGNRELDRDSFYELADRTYGLLKSLSA
jgi:hypothetical protein